MHVKEKISIEHHNENKYYFIYILYKSKLTKNHIQNI